VLGVETSQSIIKKSSPAKSVLANSALVIGRQIEMLNVFIGR
jgi:hypothetical protein